MVLEPNVRVLAIKLRECIQSVETRQRARGSLSVHDVARK
jgi:hypothetical protein